MIERPRICRKALSIAEGRGHGRADGMWQVMKATLDCGHERVLDIIDGKVIDVESGSMRNGKWEKWEGTEVKEGDPVYCVTCSAVAYKALLDARPPAKAARYETREALQKAHPQAKWHEEGPVHKHGDKFYVQVYLGQHEWLAVNVDDVREVWSDPGWEGTEYGCAYVPEEEIKYAADVGVTRGEIEPPERPGKPITGDEILFAKKEKLAEYLAPGDPLRDSLKLDE